MSPLGDSHESLLTPNTPIPRKASFWNGTPRGYIFISTLVTIALILFTIVIGPQRLNIDQLHFQFCDPTQCSHHRVVYIFAFGLMCTWFLSAVFMLLLKKYRFTVAQYFLPCQIIAQVALTVLAGFLRAPLYKIGYWMFWNSIKWSVLQSILVVQTIQIIYSTWSSSNRRRALLWAHLLGIVLYTGFTTTTSLWFFGEQCNNSFDIMIVCVVTTNLVATLAAIFDKTYGFFLPLTIGALSQIYMSHALHSTPKALKCGSSPLAGFKGLEGLNLLIALVSLFVPAAKIIHYYTSQYNIDALYFNPELRHNTTDSTSPYYINHSQTSSTINSSLFHNKNSRFTLEGSTQGMDRVLVDEDDPTTSPSKSTSLTTHHSQQFTSFGKASAPRYYNFLPHIVVEEINNEIFAKEHFYTANKWCTPAVSIYLFGTFFMALFVFTTTHFGEHTTFTRLGINSNHIQWFYIMNVSSLYLVYFWYLVAMNFTCCSKKSPV